MYDLIESKFDEFYKIIINENKNKNLFYSRSYGNWGDALINAGFNRFIEKFNIKVKQLDPLILDNPSSILKKLKRIVLKRGFSNGVLLFQGGGGFSKDFELNAKKIEIATKIFDRIIILPSTFEVAPPELSRSNIITFTRDRTESLKVVPAGRFCHDFAFMLACAEQRPTAARTYSLGYFMRTDEETSGMFVVPESNRDISLEGNADTDIKDFFQQVGLYRTIITDRLHVAIAGLVMQLNVGLLPGRYFKNRAVFDSSIKDHFGDLATFIEDPDALAKFIENHK